jgi:hypothetical protein
MQIPKLPTDNFYKFLTYIGLVLMIFSISVGVFIEKNFWSNKFEIALENENIKLDSLSVHDSIEYINQSIIYQKLIFKNYYDINFDSLEQNKELINKNMFKDIRLINNNVFNLKRHENQIKQRKKVQGNLLELENIKRKFYKLIYWLLLIAFILGTIVFIYGIQRWKTRTQKYLDKKIKKESLIDGQYQMKASGLTLLLKLHDTILPKKSFEEQDWDDAAILIADQFEYIFNDLKKFRADFTPIYLDTELNVLINTSIEQLNSHLTFTEDQRIEIAQTIYDNITKLISKTTELVNKEIDES